MNAPDRIWAMPSDDGWMSPYCGNAPHDGSTEYVRADLSATQDARVQALEDAVRDALGRLDASLFTNAEHQQAKDILRAMKGKP